MVEDLDAIVTNWDELITNFSPTMVEYLDTILAIWDELVTNFSPTMVEDLDAILAIWEELNYKIFSNDSGRFKCNFSH